MVPSIAKATQLVRKVYALLSGGQGLKLKLPNPAGTDNVST